MTESCLMSASQQAPREFSARSFFEISKPEPQATGELSEKNFLIETDLLYGFTTFILCAAAVRQKNRTDS